MSKSLSYIHINTLEGTTVFRYNNKIFLTHKNNLISDKDNIHNYSKNNCTPEEDSRIRFNIKRVNKSVTREELVKLLTKCSDIILLIENPTDDEKLTAIKRNPSVCVLFDSISDDLFIKALSNDSSVFKYLPNTSRELIERILNIDVGFILDLSIRYPDIIPMLDTILLVNPMLFFNRGILGYELTGHIRCHHLKTLKFAIARLGDNIEDFQKLLWVVSNMELLGITEYFKPDEIRSSFKLVISQFDTRLKYLTTIDRLGMLYYESVHETIWTLTKDEMSEKQVEVNNKEKKSFFNTSIFEKKEFYIAVIMSNILLELIRYLTK